MSAGFKGWIFRGRRYVPLLDSIAGETSETFAVL